MNFLLLPLKQLRSDITFNYHLYSSKLYIYLNKRAEAMYTNFCGYTNIYYTWFHFDKETHIALLVIRIFIMHRVEAQEYIYETLKSF